MKKLLSGVKRALSSGLSSRGSGSRSSDNGSQNSPRSLSFMPSPHRTAWSSLHLAHDDVPATTDGEDISIYSTEEMERYGSLHRGEFAHSRVYNVNLLERVGFYKEHPTIIWTTDWGKLYDEPHLGSRLLTLEFLMTFKIVEKNRKSFVMFCLFRISFGCDFSRFSELLDFSKSCLPESSLSETLIRLSLVMLFLENLPGLGSVIFTTLV
jgi:hypothetical protein